LLLPKATGAKYMQVSNSKAFYANKWMLYNPELEWQLEPGPDGIRNIYIRFKDAAQNETEIISTSLIVDREPPIGGGITINNNEKYTIQQDRNINLSLTARNADFMQVSTDNTFKDVEWLPYNNSLRYKLDDQDGEKTVYVRFKDKAGNMTIAYSSKIIIDTTPPKDCQVVIDGGAEATAQIDKWVTLTLQATGDTDYMMISNSTGFFGAKWMIYKPTLRWKLDGEEDGERGVYVKFKDKAGNVSTIFSDKIILQRDF